VELNHLRYFYVVGREGSFTRASKVLRIQQPTISKMVKALEDSLGMVLLERHKTGVRMTKSGIEVFRRCEDIFGRVDEITAISAAEQTECQGLLSFGLTDSATSYVLPRILGRFLRRHPKVRPSIFAGSSNLICKEIEEGRVEFGLFFSDPDSDEFQVSELVEVPWQLVIAGSHARKAGVRSSLIISRDIDYPKRRPFPALEMLKRNHVKMDVLISANNLEAQKKMVLEGLGVALLPSFMIRGEMSRGSLVSLYPRKRFSHSLKLATRRRKILSRNAAVFLEQFKDEIVELL
jgi:DNA-binding transcriptional LysR family regulator